MVLFKIFDDVSLEYFRIVEDYPYLGLRVFSHSIPHSLPREVQNGKWRDSMSLKKKYEEYLSPDEISKYIDSSDGQIGGMANSQELQEQEKTNSVGFHGPNTSI